MIIKIDVLGTTTHETSVTVPGSVEVIVPFHPPTSLRSLAGPSVTFALTALMQFTMALSEIGNLPFKGFRFRAWSVTINFVRLDAKPLAARRNAVAQCFITYQNDAFKRFIRPHFQPPLQQLLRMHTLPVAAEQAACFAVEAAYPNVEESWPLPAPVDAEWPAPDAYSIGDARTNASIASVKSSRLYSATIVPLAVCLTGHRAAEIDVAG